MSTQKEMKAKKVEEEEDDDDDEEDEEDGKKEVDQEDEEDGYITEGKEEISPKCDQQNVREMFSLNLLAPKYLTIH